MWHVLISKKNVAKNVWLKTGSAPPGLNDGSPLLIRQSGQSGAVVNLFATLSDKTPFSIVWQQIIWKQYVFQTDSVSQYVDEVRWNNIDSTSLCPVGSSGIKHTTVKPDACGLYIPPHPHPQCPSKPQAYLMVITLTATHSGRFEGISRHPGDLKKHWISP